MTRYTEPNCNLNANRASRMSAAIAVFATLAIAGVACNADPSMPQLGESPGGADDEGFDEEQTDASETGIDETGIDETGIDETEVEEEEELRIPEGAEMEEPVAEIVTPTGSRLLFFVSEGGGVGVMEAGEPDQLSFLSAFPELENTTPLEVFLAVADEGVDVPDGLEIGSIEAAGTEIEERGLTSRARGWAKSLTLGTEAVGAPPSWCGNDWNFAQRFCHTDGLYNWPICDVDDGAGTQTFIQSGRFTGAFCGLGAANLTYLFRQPYNAGCSSTGTGVLPWFTLANGWLSWTWYGGTYKWTLYGGKDNGDNAALGGTSYYVQCS